MTSGPDNIIEILIKRHDLLSCMYGQPKRKPEMVDECDTSRSTIYRGVKELTSAGIINRTQDGHSLTVFGALVFENFRNMRHQLEYLSDHTGENKTITVEDWKEGNIFKESDIILPTRLDEGKPLDYLIEDMKDSDMIRMVTPVVHPAIINEYHESPKEYPEIQLISNNHYIKNNLEYMLKSLNLLDTNDDFQLYGTEIYIPFGVVLLGSGDNVEVDITIFGESNSVISVLKHRAEEGIEWAEEIFENTRAKSQPFRFE
ncbi:MAG: hypothetical protein ABEK59_00455 [Halobacteria archaeon]